MKYPLQTVQNIRKRREELAEAKLAEAQSRQLKCEEAKRAAEQELTRFREWRTKEEVRLLGEVMAGPLENREVVSAREQIVWNKSLEPSYVKKVQEAEDKLEQAKEEVNRLQSELHALRKESMKLRFHREEWEKDIKKDEESREEEELDEISTAMFQSQN